MKIKQLICERVDGKRTTTDVPVKKIQKEVFVREGPLVMNKTPKRTVAIGIDATSGYKDDATHSYYHKIKTLEKALCDTAGIGESTILNPDTQTSVDSSPSDSSGSSTLKPTMKSPVTSKKSKTPPQRTIDEFEVAPEDNLYDEEKRRAQ
ncbi:unnamed protein product [Caenorhabditis brenneri]